MTVLGIVDHAARFVRLRPMIALGTVVPCSLPLAGAAILGFHLIVTYQPEPLALLIGAAALSMLLALRSVGWGAAARGVQAMLDPGAPEPSGLLPAALRQAPDLFGVQAMPLMGGLFGLLLTVAPIVLSIFASNLKGNFFGSMALAIFGATIGSVVLLLALIYVGRRSLGVAAVAHESLPGPAALRRSRDLILGQTVRALALQAYLLLAFVTLWLTLLFSGPILLMLLKMLTGLPMIELSAVLSPGNPTTLMFQAAVAFVILEPIRCFSFSLLYADCRIRREGADLRAQLQQWASRGQPMSVRP